MEDIARWEEYEIRPEEEEKAKQTMDPNYACPFLKNYCSSIFPLSGRFPAAFGCFTRGTIRTQDRGAFRRQSTY